MSIASFDYRPVSRLAVAAMFAGIGSLVVFVGPPMTVVVPFAALFTSLAALRRVGRMQALAGRRLALAGLALSTFSLAGGPAYWLVGAWQSQRAAATVAEAWIDSVRQCDLRRAHQMTLPGERRFLITAPLADSYAKFPEARAALAKFAEDPAVAAVGKLADASYRLGAIEEHGASRTDEWFGLSYEFDVPGAVPLRIVVRRIRSGPRGASWHVAGYALAAENAP